MRDFIVKPKAREPAIGEIYFYFRDGLAHAANLRKGIAEASIFKGTILTCSISDDLFLDSRFLTSYGKAYIGEMAIFKWL